MIAKVELEIQHHLSSCAAYRVNEQKVCPDCGLCWDHDDPDPPKCKSRTRRTPPPRRRPNYSFWRRHQSK